VFCDLLFASGSAALQEKGTARLEKFVPSLRAATGPIDIRGYSDSSPIGHARPEQLRRLSQARADAVKRFLADHGVPLDRMTATGMGSVAPKETRAASRRVEITWQE
jgi:flagellar motor protein MotB